VTIDNEIEIKISVPDVEPIRNKLENLHFKLILKESFEFNIVLDTTENKFQNQHCLLRLRKSDGKNILTFKRPPPVKPDLKDYKIMEEMEVEVSNFEKTRDILLAMGYRIYFIYEKYRGVYQREGVKVMIDKTPIGNFIEIEGDQSLIDRVATELGFSRKHYMTETYFSLFKKTGRNGFMQFE